MLNTPPASPRKSGLEFLIFKKKLGLGEIEAGVFHFQIHENFGDLGESRCGQFFAFFFKEKSEYCLVNSLKLET